MAHSLPVIVPHVENQRYSCQGCTRCCRELVVHLFPADRDRIDRQGWRAELGVDPYVPLGREWVLNKRADGACVFLSDDGKCKIHTARGYQSKPLACRVYPFTLRRSGDRWQSGIRFDCPSVARSQGQPIASHRDDLGHIADELKSGLEPESQRVELRAGMLADAHEVQHLVQAMDEWLADDNQSTVVRLRGAVWVTEMLSKAKLAKVRGERFAELVNILFDGAAGETQALHLMPAGPRHRKLLRQLAYAFGQSATLEQMRAGAIGKTVLKWRQLREARRYRRGRGPVPRGCSDDSTVRFEQVETVQPVRGEDIDPVSELVIRYVRSRLLSESVFGGGYYGWSVFDGLRALWLSLVVVAWQARLIAVRAGRLSIDLNDVVESVGYVDRGSGRLPALGTYSERLRTRYLSADGGIQRLFNSYPLFED